MNIITFFKSLSLSLCRGLVLSSLAAITFSVIPEDMGHELQTAYKTWQTHEKSVKKSLQKEESITSFMKKHLHDEQSFAQSHWKVSHSELKKLRSQIKKSQAFKAPEKKRLLKLADEVDGFFKSKKYKKIEVEIDKVSLKNFYRVEDLEAQRVYWVFNSSSEVESGSAPQLQNAYLKLEQKIFTLEKRNKSFEISLSLQTVRRFQGLMGIRRIALDELSVSSRFQAGSYKRYKSLALNKALSVSQKSESDYHEILIPFQKKSITVLKLVQKQRRAQQRKALNAKKLYLELQSVKEPS